MIPGLAPPETRRYRTVSGFQRRTNSTSDFFPEPEATLWNVFPSVLASTVSGNAPVHLIFCSPHLKVQRL